MSEHLSLRCIYAGSQRVHSEWCYTNVISPFSRLFLITGGKGAVYMNKQKYELSAGDLFIIPKFTFHTYECEQYMDHCYICFFDEMIGQRGLWQVGKMRYQVRANELDTCLVKRFLELNDDCAIKNINPKAYDNRPELFLLRRERLFYQTPAEIESRGILLQLFSRFIAAVKVMDTDSRNQYERLDKVLNYIDNHLNIPIQVSELASLMCISTDHFSRIFSKVMGVRPCTYIQSKRMERAQTLLLISRFSITEVAEMVGIPNLSQFSRLFAKATGHAPRDYRTGREKQTSDEINCNS